MKKRLNSLLEAEIKRFNNIVAYQDKLQINEVSYRFYNDMDEAEGDMDNEDELIDGTEDGITNQQGVEPTDFTDIDNAGEPEMGNNEPEMNTAVEPQIDTMEPMAGEETTEVDVTELVNSNNEIKAQIGDLNSGFQKLTNLFSKIDRIENNIVKMDGIINQINTLAKQVELMRPPTEEERRKALAQDSYPFNVTIDDYNNGNAVKNQTELENQSKMSMYDTLMKDYNEMDIKNSFNIPTNNMK